MNDEMTLPTAARLLGIGRGSVYEAVKRGSLKARRVGRDYLVTRQEVENYKKRRVRKAAA